MDGWMDEWKDIFNTCGWLSKSMSGRDWLWYQKSREGPVLCSVYFSASWSWFISSYLFPYFLPSFFLSFVQKERKKQRKTHKYLGCRLNRHYSTTTRSIGIGVPHTIQRQLTTENSHCRNVRYLFVVWNEGWWNTYIHTYIHIYIIARVCECECEYACECKEVNRAMVTKSTILHYEIIIGWVDQIKRVRVT